MGDKQSKIDKQLNPTEFNIILQALLEDSRSKERKTKNEIATLDKELKELYGMISNKGTDVIVYEKAHELSIREKQYTALSRFQKIIERFQTISGQIIRAQNENDLFTLKKFQKDFEEAIYLGRKMNIFKIGELEEQYGKIVYNLSSQIDQKKLKKRKSLTPINLKRVSDETIQFMESEVGFPQIQNTLNLSM